jgi:hypothetical protein
MIRTTEGQADEPSPRCASRRAGIRAGWFGRIRSMARPPRADRLLFLDDDPNRAALFLKNHPEAIWVTTVSECLDRLTEPWDEIHLDHDLGGKMFVDSTDTDCGMEVIRWLCKEPRRHLKKSLFYVHTHNVTAGLLMVLHMQGGGYRAEFRPFGLDLQQVLAHNEPEPEASTEPTHALWTRLARRLGSLWRGRVAR